MTSFDHSKEAESLFTVHVVHYVICWIQLKTSKFSHVLHSYFPFLLVRKSFLFMYGLQFDTF